MKITGTSSYVKIEFEGKVVKASGEMLVGGFVAFKNSMKQWEAPHSNEKFSEQTRDRIINATIDFCKDKDFKVEFE